MSALRTATPAIGLFREIVCFAGAGTAGFAVDLGATLLFAGGFGMAAGAARLAAIALAVAVTFALNRKHTFRSANPRILGEAARYVAVSAAGATVNFAVYAAVMAAIAAKTPVAITLAIAAGSAVAMLVNYAGSRLFAFRKLKL